MSGDNFDPRSPPQDIEWIRNLSFQFFLRGLIENKTSKTITKEASLGSTPLPFSQVNLCFLSIWALVFAIVGAIFLRADQVGPKFPPGTDPYKWSYRGPLWMAKNNWVIGVITPISGVITYL